MPRKAKEVLMEEEWGEEKILASVGRPKRRTKPSAKKREADEAEVLLAAEEIKDVADDDDDLSPIPKIKRAKKDPPSCSILPEVDTAAIAQVARAQAAQAGAAQRQASKDEGKKGHGSKGRKEPKERREDRFGNTVVTRSSCPQHLRERVQRAKPNSGHRLFLVSRKIDRPVDHPEGPCETFAVLGATGNVYDVEVSRFPGCSCPDFAKRRDLCKHLLFVYLRVLRMSETDPCVYQKALLPSEAIQVLSGGRGQFVYAGDQPVAEASVREAYARMTSGEATTAPRDDNECCICFDDMDTAKESFCASCKHAVHTQCISMWCEEKRRGGESRPSCPLCRAPWVDGRKGKVSGEPINLAGFSSAHRGMDGSLEALYGDNARWIRWHQGR